VLTDHSPRLTVARGLSADRLRQQIELVAAINAELPEGFRILTGIEVDILADGSLDQEEELLAQLDVVVGSVHSNLRDDSETMTKRMLAAELGTVSETFSRTLAKFREQSVVKVDGKTITVSSPRRLAELLERNLRG